MAKPVFSNVTVTPDREAAPTKLRRTTSDKIAKYIVVTMCGLIFGVAAIGAAYTWPTKDLKSFFDLAKMLFDFISPFLGMVLAFYFVKR